METATSSSKQWELASHLSAFAGYIIPFGHIIGPLVVWSLKKDEFPSVDAHGKESLNFQLSFTLYMFLNIFLIFIVIGFVILGALVIIQIVFIIVATLKADKGELYRYPLTIKFIK